MTLGWPWALAGLLLLPALWLFGRWMARRRRKDAVVVSSVSFARAAQGSRSKRRLIPAALLAAGIVVLIGAGARPNAVVPVPISGSTIVLAIDVSSSMCATDVDPNRIVAAQEAATEFVTTQAAGARIGIVAFSSIAALVVAPTTDTDALVEAIDGLTTSRGTAIGLAILASIDAIAEVDPDVAPTGVDLTGEEPASNPDAAIVVLTDGSNSEGVDPVTAAEQAAARGLAVYTIGFGTDDPGQSVCDASQIDAGAATGGDSGGGGGPSRDIDEETLTQVAETTGGEYYRAEDADELQSVLGSLPGEFATELTEVEITGWVALGGTVLVLAGLGTGLALRAGSRRRQSS
ncbi:MAG: VWA domain-containing protein [Protaetiibacter sp.]